MYLIRGVSIRGKLFLSTNPEYKNRGADMWRNVVLILEVKVQVRDLYVRVVVLLPPLPHGESVFGENSFYRTQGGKWAPKTCDGCLQQRYAMRKPDKVQRRDPVGIVEGSCKYRARGSIFAENSFYRETRGTKLVGSPCV